MIFVTLGTQDKSFSRLLEAIDCEIANGLIKEKVIVQAGFTEYSSKRMEILKFISMDEFNKYIKECNLLITHAGVGSIMSGLNNNKKVIAVARLAAYKEHTNDHQIQIAMEFAKEGYILYADDLTKLGATLKKVKTFKPRKLVSNNANFLNLIADYIDHN